MSHDSTGYPPCMLTTCELGKNPPLPWYFSSVTTEYLARIFKASGLNIPMGAVVLLLWKITGRVSHEKRGIGTPAAHVGEAAVPRARRTNSNIVGR